MDLAQALRMDRKTSLAFVGAGGKTTALTMLAREMVPCVAAVTTHFGAWQTSFASIHTVLEPRSQLPAISFCSGIHLLTGPKEGDRFQGVSEAQLTQLWKERLQEACPLLIEADGARGLPLKAPAEYEPVIPAFINTVVVVAGLRGLAQRISDQAVHRSAIFCSLAGIASGELLTSDVLARVLRHPQGGLRSIPSHARRILLLNQADSPELRAAAFGLAAQLIGTYDSIVIASLQNPQADDESVIQAVHEPAAGIILAAGSASRFGAPKQLLKFHGEPFVRRVARIALEAHLSPVIIITGAYAPEVQTAVEGLPVQICHNPNWQDGQSTSIQAGLDRLPAPPHSPGSAIFLMADQPQITSTLLTALVEKHSLSLEPVIAPLVQGTRSSPLLFDRRTFPDFACLRGDTGGRALLSRYRIAYLPWQDERVAVDIDTPGDLDLLG